MFKYKSSSKSVKEEKGPGNDSSDAAATPPTQSADTPAVGGVLPGTATEYLDGNYQLRVHIIECSELISPSGSGFVSPAVFVEVLEQKVHTKQKSKVSGCVFDESFYIQLDDMNESRIQDGNIAVNVVDCSHKLTSFGNTKTVGSFSIDLETVYQSSGHEIYRQWVPLLSPTTSDISGKLLLSLTLLGPGDKAVVHDRKAEIALEKSQRQRGGLAGAVGLFMPPALTQKLRYLVVEIFKAEGIPVLDIPTGGEQAYNYISASIAVEFDKHDRVKTDTAHLNRGQMNDADYLTALWLPYMDPCFSGRVQLRLLEHHSTGQPEVQSSSHCPSMQLRCIKYAMEGNAIPAGQLDPTQLFWVNMYGAPVPETFTGRQTQKLDKNTYPESASAYRGRLLVRLRISEKRPEASGKRKVAAEVFKCAITRDYVSATATLTASSDSSAAPTLLSALGSNAKSNSTDSVVLSPGGGDGKARSKISTNVTGAPPAPIVRSSGASAEVMPKDPRQSFSAATSTSSITSAGSSAVKPKPTGIMGLPLPRTRRYVLKAMVYAGHAFPQRYGMSSSRYSVELRLMHRRLLTPELRMDSGYAAWDQPVFLKETFELPDDPAMLPDLFLYVLNKSEELAPLSYKRFPLTRFLSLKEDQQFNQAADWEILQLDDCYSFASPDTFPGAVLIKLGFGKERVADLYPWQTSVKTKCSPCQVNIHLYQGRGLPPSDSSGLLDPYALVRVGTSTIKTKVHKQTRDPQFFETLPFHMDLPDDDNLKPQLFLELWDQDLAGDDFVGLLKLDLALADKRSVAGQSKAQLLGAALRKPEWFGLRSRTGADLMGQLLVGFEILRLEKSGAALLPTPALEPETQSWVLDMRVLGLRDLETPGLLPINRPYAHITLQGEEVRKLPPSRKPTPTDPNYCINFEEVVQLPRDTRYAPSLTLTVKDRRFPGTPSTVLGVASIPLERKMIAALAAPGGDAGSLSGTAAINYSNRFRSGNPFVSQESLIRSQIGMNDSAATTEEDKVRMEDEQREEQQRQEARAALPPAIAALRALVPKDDMPEYLHGRLQLKGELETSLTATPFERYPITTGSVAGGMENALDRKFAMVGVLKCAVDVRPEGVVAMAAAVSETAVPNVKEQDVRIRLYVLRGSGLTGQDDDNNSDPFLMVKFGKKTFTTRDRYKKNTKEPRFFECFEFNAKLPGVNDILITVKDRNDFRTDALIGSTVIDLEDRWFSQQWKDLCRIAPAALPRGTVMEPRAPLEVRSLWHPASSSPQGSLSMWMDILTLEEAKRFPAKNIAPPPAEDWEVRVIVWSAKEVPVGDEFEQMTDLYIKCRLGGDAAQEQSTDTHLRLPAGQKGSFNWRMKFPLKLPVPEDCEGGTRLTIEAWDLDIITSSQGLGSCQFDLSDALDTAMCKRIRKLKLGKSARFTHQVFYKPRPPDSTEAAQNRSSRPEHTSMLGSCCSFFSSCFRTLCCCFCCTKADSAAPSVGSGNADSEATQLDDVDLEAGGVRGATEATPLLSSGSTSGASREYQSASGAGAQEEQDPDEQEDLPDLTSAAVPAGDAGGATVGSAVAKKRKRKKRPTMFDSTVQAMGFAPAVIEHAEELQLTDARGQPAGKVLVSIEILHKSVADTLPAGLGRGEPNMNPALPDPEGRIDFTKMWNPFYLLRVCAGEKIFAEFACIFSCLACMVIYYFIGQPFLTLFLAFEQLFGWTLMLVMMVAMIVGGCLFCWHARARCRKVCCSSEDEDSAV